MNPGITQEFPEASCRQALEELRRHLETQIIPFWRERARDAEYGGYLTGFNVEGDHIGTDEKYLNTQCRLLWWFSTLARRFPEDRIYPDLASHGFSYIASRFYDTYEGGWYWKTDRSGRILDDAKIVYGQSFAIYALAAYARALEDARAGELAAETFSALQNHAADNRHGGYLENLDRRWAPLSGEPEGAGRKSLDTHMHLMESFTSLAALTGKPHHRRRLHEVSALILDRMIDSRSGCGGNHFDDAFQPVPAIALQRTWNAERRGAPARKPAFTTSYGHNLELCWLFRLAMETVQAPLEPWLEPLRRLASHALEHGWDREHGGVYRDGDPTGGPVVLEKEFWQNAEALAGFLDAFELFGERIFLDAFLSTWAFSRDHFIAPCGEWRILLGRDGTPLVTDVGNAWKVSYHTGRAVLECVDRLERLLARAN